MTMGYMQNVDTQDEYYSPFVNKRYEKLFLEICVLIEKSEIESERKDKIFEHLTELGRECACNGIYMSPPKERRRIIDNLMNTID